MDPLEPFPMAPKRQNSVPPPRPEPPQPQIGNGDVKHGQLLYNKHEVNHCESLDFKGFMIVWVWKRWDDDRWSYWDFGRIGGTTIYSDSLEYHKTNLWTVQTCTSISSASHSLVCLLLSNMFPALLQFGLNKSWSLRDGTVRFVPRLTRAAEHSGAYGRPASSVKMSMAHHTIGRSQWWHPLWVAWELPDITRLLGLNGARTQGCHLGGCETFRPSSCSVKFHETLYIIIYHANNRHIYIDYCIEKYIHMILMIEGTWKTKPKC